MRKSILAILLFFTSTIAFGQDAVSEDALKAAFIFHFLDFTDWQDEQAQYYVCIPDDQRLRTVAQQSLEGKVIHGRTVTVVNRYDHCHVLVSDHTPPTETMFTIGPLTNGSLLEFRLIDNKLKFAVNMEKLRKSKLKISSQLLKLAIMENG